MKIRYLGTAASEGVPALFCQCEICRNARQTSGREIRTRCQAMVNDDLLIDFGPDTYSHLLRYSIDITELEYCLITHTHSDHLYVDDLGTRCRGYANLSPSVKPLTVFGSGGVRDAVVRYKNDMVTEDGSVLFRQVYAFVPFEFGGYRVIPVPAIHSTSEPFVYVIGRDGKTLLYAHDTDILPEDSLKALRRLGVSLDLVSMDCNEGIKHMDYRGHMNIERDLVFRQRLFDFGLADANTVFVANHFSHNGRLSYAEAVKIGEEYGIVISYDGMEIEI